MTFPRPAATSSSTSSGSSGPPRRSSASARWARRRRRRRSTCVPRRTARSPAGPRRSRATAGVLPSWWATSRTTGSPAARRWRSDETHVPPRRPAPPRPGPSRSTCGSPWRRSPPPAPAGVVVDVRRPDVQPPPALVLVGQQLGPTASSPLQARTTSATRGRRWPTMSLPALARVVEAQLVVHHPHAPLRRVASP